MKNARNLNRSLTQDSIISITRSIITFLFLTGFFVACDSGKDKNSEVIESVVCKLDFATNLDSRSEVLQADEFSVDRRDSYSVSYETSLIDKYNIERLVSVYLVRTSEQLNTWELYFFVDKEPVDVKGGSIGGEGQLKAVLKFDEDGIFQETLPENIQIKQFISSYSTYTRYINIEFQKDNTTQSFSSFSFSKINGGCDI